MTRHLNRIWDACLPVAILASISVVALGVVIPGIAENSLPYLYGVDVICWADILRRYSRFKHLGPGPYAGRFGLVILAVTAPWELILPASSLVEGALPMLWALRLFRVVQLNAFLYNQEVLSLQRPGLLRLMRLVINIMVVSHCLACGWLLLGYMDLNASWLHAVALTSATSESQYIRALYWTITTMTTVGYGDITPVLDREYLFAGLVMLVGASFYAYIIGNVASLVGQINESKAKYHQRAQFVTGYLYEQGVSAKLVGRVQAYYHNHWERYRNFNKDDLLSDLPQSLALDIKTQLARRILQDVPLFRHASRIIREQLMASLQFEFVDPESVIARNGERNQKLVFVIDGQLDILFEDDVVGCFGPGDYFGNYSLILNEPRTASVVAKTYCELMYLHRKDYEEIKDLYPEFVDVMKKAMADNSEKMSEMVLLGVVL